MNESRRKLIISAPLFGVTLLTGCGGGGSDGGASSSAPGLDRHAQAAAIGKTSTQTLQLSATTGTLDAIWLDPAGSYIVPASSVSVQAVISGNDLLLALVESVTLPNMVMQYRSFNLKAHGSAAPAAGGIYTQKQCVGSSVVVLRRAPNGNLLPTDEVYTYQSSFPSTDSNVLTITSLDANTRQAVLTFDKLSFLGDASRTGSNAFAVSGQTTLKIPLEAVAWM